MLLEFSQQPAFLQRRQAARHLDRTVEHERRGGRKRPDHCFHRVASQLFERRNPLITINDHVTAGLISYGRHHDRRLLPCRRQRRQQPSLPLRLSRPQMLPAPVELVKLQFHRRPRARLYYGPSCISAFASEFACVPLTLLQSATCALISDCAARSRTVPITPMKSAPCTVNSDCARSHGSCDNGGGKRNGPGASSCALRSWIRRPMK